MTRASVSTQAFHGSALDAAAGHAGAPASRAQARRAVLRRLRQRLLAQPLGVAGLLLILLIATLALAAPWLPLADPATQTLGDRLLPPSSVHWFGTDTLGRDLLSRIVWGARPTLAIVALVLLLSVPAGVLLGAAAGLAGGWLDALLMRISDVFMAFPRLILALAVAAAIGPGLWTAVAAIALTAWPPYARVARAEVVSIRNAEFMQAARALGASPLRLLLRHALPLCTPSALVRAALDAPGVLLIVAGLGFLGLGLPPPAPEWGAMVADGRAILFEAWWVSTIPGLWILAASLGFNLFGDALRDAIDPGLR